MTCLFWGQGGKTIGGTHSRSVRDWSKVGYSWPGLGSFKVSILFGGPVKEGYCTVMRKVVRANTICAPDKGTALLSTG